MALYWIKAPHFTAAINVDSTTLSQEVFETAPVVKYMKGWDFGKVMDYCIKKNWELNLVGEK